MSYFPIKVKNCGHGFVIIFNISARIPVVHLFLKPYRQHLLLLSRLEQRIDNFSLHFPKGNS